VKFNDRGVVPSAGFYLCKARLIELSIMQGNLLMGYGISTNLIVILKFIHAPKIREFGPAEGGGARLR